MGSHSSRSSTETSLSIWRRSKPTRAAWWSFVTSCEDIVASHGTPPPNQAMERTATRPVFTFEISNHFHFGPHSLSVAVAHLVLVRTMQRTLFGNRAASGLILLTALAQSAIRSEAATPVPLSPPSIDGTYELTERVMANGA